MVVLVLVLKLHELSVSVVGYVQLAGVWSWEDWLNWATLLCKETGMGINVFIGH